MTEYSIAAIETIVSDCEVLHPPTNGSLSTNIRIFGTKVNVSCDAGFTLPVQNYLYCHDDGQWNGSVRECWKGYLNKIDGINATVKVAVSLMISSMRFFHD